MKHSSLQNSSRIARRAVHQGARPAVTPQAAIEKSATVGITTSNTCNRLMKSKMEVRISTFNVQTLRKEEKIPELIASSENTCQDIVCIQEHRYIHEDSPTKEHAFGTWKLITCSAWKNDVNAAVGGIGMLLSNRAYKALASVEMITNRIMIATFYGNPKTTLICCYSPTNVSDESDVEDFYASLESLTRRIPKHNMLIIGGDFNAHLGRNDGFTSSYHSETNRNGSKMKDYLQANELICLNTSFSKRQGQLWTHKAPNGVLSQLDFMLINQKWRNSVKNCRSFNSFISLSSDHRIVTAQISLTLRANKKKSSAIPSYNWTTLKNDPDITSSFVTTLSNRFSILQNLQESQDANTTYENFEKACREAATTTIPLKPKRKHRKPWENEEVCRKREQLHQAQHVKESSPTPENILLLNEARSALKDAYRIEQTNYLQSKITKIKNSSANKQSAEAWKTVNEITGRKSSNASKIKAATPAERTLIWNKHFEDLLGKPPVVTDHIITPIISKELNIKKGNFTMEELKKAVKSTKNRKACGLNKIPAEVWKLPEFHQILLDCCNSVYNQDPIKRWTEGCILPFPKKGDLSLAKNYRGITLTTISAKIYNLLLLNRIRPEVDPLLRKNQNGFRTNRSTSGQILTIRRVLEGVNAKNLPATLLFIDFSKAFDSIHRERMKNILLAYGIPLETVNGIMMLYKNTRSMV